MRILALFRHGVPVLALAPGVLAQGTAHQWSGPAAGGSFGHAVALVDDLDGDGARELAVAAPGLGPAAEGAVFLYDGASGALLRRFDGAGADARLGSSVSRLGDVDGDGVGDFAAGAVGAFVPGSGRTGQVVVYSGADGRVLHAIDGKTDGEQFGYSLDGGFDLDADGVPDLIAGAPLGYGRESGSGLARVISGATGAIVTDYPGADSGDRFGHAVACVGDVDKDLWPDFVIGAPDDDELGPDAGAATVVSGWFGLAFRRYYGTAAGGGFGSAVDGAGDVDGDALPDVIVGAPGELFGSTSTGAAHVLSSLSGATLYTFRGPHAGGAFGVSVAGAGDFDGDGHPDLAVGAWRADLGARPDAGSVTIHSGASGHRLRVLWGTHANDGFGWSLAGGDALASGKDPDLVAGAVAHDSLGANTGAAWAFLGFGSPEIQASPLVAGQPATVTGSGFAPRSRAQFGISFSGGGPTAAGIGDVLLSAPVHVLPSVAVDAQGALVFTTTIPPSWSGRTLWVQAVDDEQRTLSNGLAAIVQ